MLVMGTERMHGRTIFIVLHGGPDARYLPRANVLALTLLPR